MVPIVIVLEPQGFATPDWLASLSTDARSEALHALSRFLITDASLGETLQYVTELAMRAMPKAEIAGISMLDDKERPITSVYTDESSPEIDAGQYESGMGPCLDAWRLQVVVRIEDMRAATDRYPLFASYALAHGVLSTISLPLMAGGQGLGALNLYARSVGGFSEEDEEIGTELSAAASIVLSNATAYWGALELSEQLTEAMESRAVIEQAKGVIMGAMSCTADEAFNVLRQQSQTENRKLRDIAQEITSGQVRRPA
jgi:GAF domain-containing protein